MLFSNTCLEVLQKENTKERELELTNLYGRPLRIDVDKEVSEKLISVEAKTHKYLSLKNEDGKLKLIKDNSDSLFIVLDLFDYKCFNKNSLLLKQKDDKNFNSLRFYRTSNICGKCKWGLHILEVKDKQKFSILKMRTTSGKEKYLVVYKGYVTLHNDKSLFKYLSKNKIKFNLKETEWELLKK